MMTAAKRQAPATVVLAAFAVAAILVLSGCIGAIEREEFEAEMRARGGGFDESTVFDAADAVGDRLGTTDFEITKLGANPSSDIVTMQVLDPRNPKNVDDYTIRGGSIHSVSPVRVSVRDDGESTAFRIRSVALDELNEMADEALAEYDTEGGHVSMVSIRANRAVDNPEVVEPRIFFSLESTRSRATAHFQADGTLISVDPQ
jgi:hypothetical protein